MKRKEALTLVSQVSYLAEMPRVSIAAPIPHTSFKVINLVEGHNAAARLGRARGGEREGGERKKDFFCSGSLYQKTRCGNTVSAAERSLIP